MQQSDRIGTKKLLVTAYAKQALTEILRGVGGGGRGKSQAVMDAGEQGAIPAKQEPLAQLVPDGQICPQVPQFPGSLIVLTHV